MPTHLTLGSRVGLSQEQLAQIHDYRTSPLFGARERLALEYADEMARLVRVDERLYSRLRAEFSETELVELCVAVGLAHLINRFHGTFETELDRRPGDFTQKG